MPHYVMLNFEDADSSAPTMGKIKRYKDSTPTSVGGAADGTFKLYQRRAKKKSSFFKGKEIVYYSCQELIDRDRNHRLSRKDVSNIRSDCSKAKTIAIVIHGTPNDTEHGFATGGHTVCTWGQLGNLAMLCFPDKRKRYNVALVMCYGARSENARLDHRGMLSANDLKSSFAYKFFRYMCSGRNVRLTARTGAVSNDGALDHVVETEEQVFYVLDRQDAMQQRRTNKKDMDALKDQLLKGGFDERAFQNMVSRFAMQPNLQPTTPEERFAKAYVIYSPLMGAYIKNRYQSGSLGNRDKIGKLIYEYNGTLTIVARYGTTTHDPNCLLYSGPLL